MKYTRLPIHLLTYNHTSKHLSLFLIALLLTATVTACGKKGDPTLKSYEKPAAPANLTVLHREDEIYLKWSYPPAKENLIAQFIVLRSIGGDFEKLSHIEKDRRTYTDKEIKTGSSYKYKVISQNFRGVYSDDSDTVSVTPAKVPAPPTKLSYAVSGNRITITWQPANRYDLFNIYKSTKKGTYSMTPVNSEPLKDPVFSDTFSVNNVSYYTVRSLTHSSIRDEGPASEELTVDAADLVPPMPLNLEAFAAPDKVILSWAEASEIWVTGYNVYRKTDGNKFVLLGKTQTPTFLDPEAAVSKREYRVTAVGKAKEGPAAEIRNVIYIPQQ